MKNSYSRSIQRNREFFAVYDSEGNSQIFLRHKTQLKFSEAVGGRVRQCGFWSTDDHSNTRQAVILPFSAGQLSGNVYAICMRDRLELHFDEDFARPVDHLSGHASAGTDARNRWPPKAIQYESRNLQTTMASQWLGHDERVPHMRNCGVRSFIFGLALGSLAYALPKSELSGTTLTI